jgi:hypothetical protein
MLLNLPELKVELKLILKLQIHGGDLEKLPHGGRKAVLRRNCSALDIGWDIFRKKIFLLVLDCKRGTLGKCKKWDTFEKNFF